MPVMYCRLDVDFVLLIVHLISTLGIYFVIYDLCSLITIVIAYFISSSNSTYATQFILQNFDT